MSKAITEVVDGSRTWEILGDLINGDIVDGPITDPVEDAPQIDFAVLGCQHDPWQKRVYSHPVIFG